MPVTRASHRGAFGDSGAGVDLDVRARSQSCPLERNGLRGTSRLSRAAQRGIASWSLRRQRSCVGPLGGMCRPGKDGVRPSRRRRGVPANRGGAGVRRATALSRVLTLRRLHPDVLTYPAIAVDETVGIVSADGTAMSRAQAHEHPRHPPHEAPPNHRGVSARKPRSADLLQLYVFGRKRGRLSWNETSSQQTQARPLRARLRRAGPHG